MKSRIALGGALLCLMLGLAAFFIYDVRQAAGERERAAEAEARELAARVGGGAALEEALKAKASRNFAAALRQLQDKYDAAWAALANPPVLDMAAVKSRADLQARAGAVRRLIQAANDLAGFAENTPDIYERELRKHMLSPEAREAELRQFMGKLAAVNPTIIALRRTEQREAEALLRVLQLLDQSWGRWEYRPASRDLAFIDPKQADDYSVAYQQFDEISRRAQSLKNQIRTGNP
jgi:hypothetical protein